MKKYLAHAVCSKRSIYLPFLKISADRDFCFPSETSLSLRLSITLEGLPYVQLELLIFCLVCFLLLCTLWDKESSAAFSENASHASRMYFEF